MNLDNYVPVNQRLLDALRRWPDLRVQETAFDIMRIEEQTFLVCEVTVWRTADDPKPSIATAAEPFPGKTPYTRGSERMVGFTSALGRALGYMGIGIEAGLASQNEVEARQDKPRPTSPQPSGTVEPTDAQIRMLRALNYTGNRPRTKKEASEIIDALKEKRIESGEDPF
jgi:hypothetical protein